MARKQPVFGNHLTGWLEDPHQNALSGVEFERQGVGELDVEAFSEGYGRVREWQTAAQKFIPKTAHEPEDRSETAGIVANRMVESSSGETEPPFQKHVPRFD